MNKIPLNHSPHTVGLFITCLANSMRPSIGFAAVKLLESAGCQVTVPDSQSCCGQPAFNSGDDEGTRRIIEATLPHFEVFDYVIVPSGSCAAMIKKSWPELFVDDKNWLPRVQSLANKTWELLSFLTDICHFKPTHIQLDGTYTYHDSCSGYRSLNIYQQPRQLLSHVDGLIEKPLQNSTECCGFGGTFCVKYSNISNAIVGEKVDNIMQTEANYLVGGDWGCLMNMAGKLHRDHKKTPTAVHAAEILADMVPTTIERP